MDRNWILSSITMFNVFLSFFPLLFLFLIFPFFVDGSYFFFSFILPGERYPASCPEETGVDSQVDLILMTDIRGPDRGFVSPPVSTFTLSFVFLFLPSVSGVRPNGSPSTGFSFFLFLRVW